MDPYCNTAPLDGWNYALFSLESILNISFVLIVQLLFYVCISQKNLHVNFRSALFLSAFGSFITALHRLIVVGARICCISQQNTALIQSLYYVQLLGMYLSLFGWLFAITERAIASVFASIYEPEFTTCAVPSTICGAVVTLSLLSLLVSALGLVKRFDFCFMVLQIAAVILCLVALLAMVLYNSSVYRARHISMMKLSDKYQLDENIRGIKYLIPVAVNNLLSKIIFILLISYSIYFTNIPLGHDTSHLSHAYDLLLAYERIFFGVALTFRSQKFDQFRNRRKVIAILDRQAVANSNHFNDLKTMWA